MVTTVALAAAGVLAPSAAAKGAGSSPSVVPASPAALDAVTVSFRVPAVVKPGDRFRVQIDLKRTGDCAGHAEAALGGAGARAGQVLTATLAPNAGGQYAGWCTGKAAASVYRVRAPSRRVAKTSFRIRRSPGFNPKLYDASRFGSAVHIDVLAASTATVSATGRPERAIGLGGAIDGFIPGKFVLNTDFRIDLGPDADTRGNAPAPGANVLFLRSLVTDPLCASPAIHPWAPVSGGTGSSLTLLRNGSVTGRIVLSADATTLAGCAGPETGTTTFDVAGKVDTAQLADLTLVATIPGVAVGAGLTGTVTVALHVKITIVDR